jgi:hypothetical protein
VGVDFTADTFRRRHLTIRAPGKQPGFHVFVPDVVAVRNRRWEAKGIAIGNVDSGKLAANKNAQVEGDRERVQK